MNAYLNNFLDFFSSTKLQNDLERKLLELNAPKVQEKDFDFKSEILDWVSNISLSSSFNYDRNKVKKLFLNILYENGQISDFQIDESLKKGYISKKARSNYNQAILNYADHCLNPEYLAEGIVNGEFSTNELSQIRFDHGENRFNFYTNYGNKNLVSNLREKLLNPKIPVKKIPEKQLILFEEKKSIEDGHCCCCC